MSDEQQTEKPKMVRLTNLTDVPWSDKIKQHDMLLKTIAVYKDLLEPGESKEVEDNEQVRRDVERYVQVGALAVGELPAAYRSKKEEQVQSARIETAKKNIKPVVVKEG